MTDIKCGICQHVKSSAFGLGKRKRGKILSLLILFIKLHLENLSIVITFSRQSNFCRDCP